MCGIIGQVRHAGRPLERQVLERMCAALEHRGPDSRGLHLDEDSVGLGIQRLRIIDLHTGDQPIYSEDRSVVVVLNGEIYNFAALRDRLRRAGHEFATGSDTEVIVHLYEEQGAACVRELHGMFGLAIWDARRRRLVLARDRVGKKPLFYSERPGALSFASELNALMEDPQIDRALDPLALDAYLAFRWVPTPLSAFRAVRKLPPGCMLVHEEGRSRIERYWRLDFSRRHRPAPAEEVFEELRGHLRAATRRRMVSDVPLGAFLSGGIDSSAVVAAMAEVSDRPVRTFSIGFEDDDLNELPQARLVADRFATEHHELVVRPDALDVVPRIVRQYGEPFADDSAIPSFYLAEMARSHVTVALNGDGGDETFGGYTRYVANLAQQRIAAVPAPLRRVMGATLRGVPAHGRIDHWRSRVRRIGEAVALDPADRYTAYMTHLNGLRREELYTPEFAELVGDSAVPRVMGDPWRASDACAPLDVMLDVDTQTYLPDDLLTKMDIATMAHSLEARSPLLDHQLLEFAATLPPELKIRGTEKKVALREALRGWVPDEILDARKRGFRLPMARWLREDLRDLSRDVLLDGTARDRGLFRPEQVARMLERHQSGAEDLSQGIWTLLVFELWHRQVVDGGTGALALAGENAL